MKTDKKLLLVMYDLRVAHTGNTATVHRRWVKSRCRGQEVQPGLAQSVCILPDKHVTEFPN